MLTLYHHPFCPFSRCVRIAFGEYGLSAEFIEERVWERRREFLIVNPSGSLPVLLDGEDVPICGIRPVLEYLDETRGPSLADKRLMPADPVARAEVRRLLDWFDGRFNDEVSGYLLHERIYKRFMPREQGGGAPDSAAIRAGKANLQYHLHYIGWLASRRNWLAGKSLSYVDLAAAAHLSCIDYLGDVPWEGFESAKQWYARIKSRPAFRPLLMDQVPGMMPSHTYVDLDF
jgi:glutathione S-transferase